TRCGRYPRKRRVIRVGRGRSGAGAAVHELRGDGGLAPGEPDRRRRKLRDGPRVALPGRRERLAPDDLAVPHQRDLEDPIVRTRVRFTGGDGLGAGYAVPVEAADGR